MTSGLRSPVGLLPCCAAAGFLKFGSWFSWTAHLRRNITVYNQSQQIDGSEEGRPGHKSLIQCQRWQKRAPLKSSSHWRNSVIGDVWTKVHGRKILNSTWRDEERDEDWDSLLCFTPWSRLILCTFYHKSKHIILNASQNLSGALSWNRILRTWPPHLDLSIRTLPKVKC